MLSILKIFSVLFCFITILLCAGCDSILPDEFQENSFKSSEADSHACSGLSQTAVDSLGALINNNYHAVTLQRLRNVLPPADTAAMQEWTDNAVIISKFNSLVSALPGLKADSLYLLRYPANQAVSYAGFTTSAGKDFLLYSSLEYNNLNINQYVTVQFIKSDTTTAIIYDDMPGESVSACTQVVVVDSKDRIVPTIKSRLRFHLDPGSYIVRFTVSQPNIVGPLKITIL